MKTARLRTYSTLPINPGNADRHHLVGNVRRVLEMVPQRRKRVVADGSPMRKRLRTQRRIAHRACIQAKDRVRTNLAVVQAGEFHEQVVRMLPVDNRLAIGRLTLLKQLWIKPSSNRRRFQAEHGAQRHFVGAKAALRHGHHPVH